MHISEVCTKLLCYCCLVNEDEKLPKTISVSRYTKPDPIDMPALAHAIPISIIEVPETPLHPLAKNKHGIITPSVYHSRDVQITPVLIKH